jgi:O-methyltransferase involved in polyketide biosynthesis
MQFIRSMPPSSGVAFDYAVARSLLSFLEGVALEALTPRVGAVRLFFEPRELAKELAEIGFRRLEDLSREEINARYFAGRGDELQVTNGIGRLMSAWGKGLE